MLKGSNATEIIELRYRVPSATTSLLGGYGWSGRIGNTGYNGDSCCL